MIVSGAQRSLADFWVAGISYATTDVATRSAYAMSPTQYAETLDRAKENGLDSIFILSTCNRIEIYGFANEVSKLTQLVIAHEPRPGLRSFHELSIKKNGLEALRHLYRVTSGLDSQILGDYEIVGQVKAAMNQARKSGFIDTYLDRLSNSALQAAKSVRTRTKLSNGTVSVAYAAVQCMRQAYEDLSECKVLLIGTGKIGRNACKSLVENIPPAQITVMNRTQEKAQALADSFGMSVAPLCGIEKELERADIILVATNAEHPIILPAHFHEHAQKLIIDLSIPNNVAPEVAALAGLTLVNVDDLSRIKDETLQQRKEEVPVAEAILNEYLEEIRDWYGTRIILHTVKDILQDLQQASHSLESGSELKTQDEMHRVISTLAVRVKQDVAIGCHCITAFKEFIEVPR
jgi:glutamyl-tRNA reductase